MFAIIVALDDLLMSIAASVIAGIAVTVVVSIAIWGMARYVDFHDADRQVAAMAALVTGIAGFVLTLAIVVTGIGLMVAG